MNKRQQAFLRFPPHTRGCTRMAETCGAILRVSPAHAGMYLLHAGHENTYCSFPRTRGDVPRGAPHRVDYDRFPPHTRGCTLVE